MPCLSMKTNAALENGKIISNGLAEIASNVLNKPEKYIMIIVQEKQDILFAGSSEPACFVEVKSIGLGSDSVTSLAERLTEYLETETGIKQDRIFIAFQSFRGDMWSWNGKTFA